MQKHVAPEGGIAPEQLVRSLPRHHHLVMDIPDVAAHQELGHGEGVVNRALGVPERPLHVAVQLLPGKTQQVLFRPGGLSHLPGNW